MCHTTDDIVEAYTVAEQFVAAYGATVLTASSYRPTVVGRDVAAHVLARPDCQPLRTA